MRRVPAVRLVAAREIAQRVGSRPLRITTAVMTVCVVAAVVIPGLVRGPARPTSIGLVGGRAQALAPRLLATAQLAKSPIALSEPPSPAAARAQVKRGRLDVALRIGPRGASAVVAQSLSPEIQGLLAVVIDAAHQRSVLGAAGLSDATIRAAQAPVPLQTVAIAPPPSHQAARSIAAIAAAFLLYLTLALYGGAVATGVAQEKTSRTAEVLIAAVRPRQLLAGKVIGIGLCGLGQLAIAAIAGLIANAAVHSAEIPSTVWLLLPAILLWFALGFALYSFAFAAAGAIVARQEEVQFVTGPIGFPLIVGYLLAYAVVASPHAVWVRVLSFIPPLAPALMPARIAFGGLAWWEMPLDVAIMLVAIYATSRAAARIYAGALVRGGSRLSWRAAIRLREKSRERA